jgi:fatty-acid desaturase
MRETPSFTAGRAYGTNSQRTSASKLPWAAIPSMGEGWHNNHHAFPASARHGLYPGELDIGFGFLKLLERLGSVWHIQTPDILPPRKGITVVRPAPGVTTGAS